MKKREKDMGRFVATYDDLLFYGYLPTPLVQPGDFFVSEVKLSTGREKKAAALVLGSLHQLERQSWHVPAARRLLSSAELSWFCDFKSKAMC